MFILSICLNIISVGCGRGWRSRLPLGSCSWKQNGNIAIRWLENFSIFGNNTKQNWYKAQCKISLSKFNLRAPLWYFSLHLTDELPSSSSLISNSSLPSRLLCMSWPTNPPYLVCQLSPDETFWWLWNHPVTQYPEGTSGKVSALYLANLPEFPAAAPSQAFPYLF